jgi:hypothetical protein
MRSAHLHHTIAVVRHHARPLSPCSRQLSCRALVANRSGTVCAFGNAHVVGTCLQSVASSTLTDGFCLHAGGGDSRVAVIRRQVPPFAAAGPGAQLLQMVETRPPAHAPPWTNTCTATGNWQRASCIASTRSSCMIARSQGRKDEACNAERDRQPPRL